MYCTRQSHQVCFSYQARRPPAHFSSLLLISILVECYIPFFRPRRTCILLHQPQLLLCFHGFIVPENHDQFEESSSANTIMKHTLNERELIKRAVRSVLQTLTVITKATTLHPSCSCHYRGSSGKQSN